MFNLFEGCGFVYPNTSSKTYTCVLLKGGKCVKDVAFKSRKEANDYMYKLMAQRKLHLKKVYDDVHAKTYICNNNCEFHINRAF